jgi:hypothetical protein
MTKKAKHIVLSLSESETTKLEKAIEKIKEKNPGMSLSYLVFDLIMKAGGK